MNNLYLLLFINLHLNQYSLDRVSVFAFRTEIQMLSFFLHILSYLGFVDCLVTISVVLFGLGVQSWRLSYHYGLVLLCFFSALCWLPAEYRIWRHEILLNFLVTIEKHLRIKLGRKSPGHLSFYIPRSYQCKVISSSKDKGTYHHCFLWLKTIFSILIDCSVLQIVVIVKILPLPTKWLDKYLCSKQ